MVNSENDGKLSCRREIISITTAVFITLQAYALYTVHFIFVFF